MMSKSGAELKAKLLANYETMLDEVLSQGQERLTLTEIEELALGARTEVGKQVTAALLEAGQGQNTAVLRCKECGQVLHNKGEKHRYLRTRSGEVELERIYYYCPQCRAGLFPPG
jgi:hypothetical protein